MPLDARGEQLLQDGLHDLLRMRLVREVKVASPAAGAELAAVVPGGVIWELLSVRFTFVTSAVVGTRKTNLRVIDGDGVSVASFGNMFNSAAGATFQSFYVAGYGAVNVLSDNIAPLADPPFVLLPSWQLQTSTVALDPADQYSAAVLTVRIWSESQIALNTKHIAQAVQSLTVDI